MTARTRRWHIDWWMRGGAWRAYVEFRDHVDTADKLEPFIAPRERFATTDADVATKPAIARLAELEAARRRGALFGHAESDWCSGGSGR